MSKAVVLYDARTGNTGQMARAVAENIITIRRQKDASEKS